MKTAAVHCKWAQRKDQVLLTFEVPDSIKPKVDFDTQKVSFQCTLKGDLSASKDIELFKEINPSESVWYRTDREVLITIKKATKEDEDEPFWPRLTKDKIKDSSIKTDFDKWKDESDDEFEDNFNFDDNMSDMMAGMGGMGGMGGLGGMDGMGDLGDDMPDSDDDDEMPDLEDANSKEAPLATEEKAPETNGDSTEATTASS